MNVHSEASSTRPALEAPGARLGRLLRAAADPWLPRLCALCRTTLRRGENGLCGHCDHALPGRHAARCARCGLHVAAACGGCGCEDCASQPLAYDRTFALADYLSPLDRAIVAIKFSHKQSLAIGLGEALGQHLSRMRWPRPPQQVTPVPLSLERLLERGFDPAAILAARIARHLRLAAPRPLLRRLWRTGAQAGLDLQARRDNVDGVFDCDAQACAALAGQVVLLVDDVMTTGATLQAAADALKCAGAAEVYNAVVARTPKNRVVSGD